MKKIRVFLADDQYLVRRGVALLLEEEPDIEVVGEARNVSEAIDGVRLLLPDVVLLDIEMPGLSSSDATRQISETSPGISVLILTTNDRRDSVSRAFRSGASGYILKRDEVNELVGAVRRLHDGEMFICRCMASKLVGDYIRQRGVGQGMDPYARLSTREREVLPLIAHGRTDHEIADIFHLSRYTVQTYRQRIMKKLGLHSRTDLLKYALRKGVISLDQ